MQINEDRDSLESALRELPKNRLVLGASVLEAALLRRSRRQQSRLISVVALLCLIGFSISWSMAGDKGGSEPPTGEMQVNASETPTIVSEEIGGTLAVPEKVEGPRVLPPPVDQVAPPVGLGGVTRAVEAICERYDLDTLTLSQREGGNLSFVVESSDINRAAVADLVTLLSPYTFVDIRVRTRRVSPGALLAVLE